MAVEVPAWDEIDRENREVWRRRYQEAIAAGFDLHEAATFASSDIDVGELRHLIELGCDGRLAASILL